MISKYLFEKITRHGHAIDRLQLEREEGKGEFSSIEEFSSIAFDAADYVWAFLAVNGYAKAQEDRSIRNEIAEKIIQILESNNCLNKNE